MIAEQDSKFIRDPRSNALINTDKTGYEKFKLEREKALHVQCLAQQVQIMQNEMHVMKQMLQQLLDGKQNG
jgi:hypothetical protein